MDSALAFLLPQIIAQNGHFHSLTTPGTIP